MCCCTDVLGMFGLFLCVVVEDVLGMFGLFLCVAVEDVRTEGTLCG